MFGDDAIGEDAGPALEQEEDIEDAMAWTVISSFFEEKGLVRQQLDSFNEFVSNTIQASRGMGAGTGVGASTHTHTHTHDAGTKIRQRAGALFCGGTDSCDAGAAA